MLFVYKSILSCVVLLLERFSKSYIKFFIVGKVINIVWYFRGNIIVYVVCGVM